jgi:BirA family transcriptional regulator, biotin operon repressor / biotin---[acetyl-CoA-carboxylase] ligase
MLQSAAAGAAEGTWLIADRQTSGRGRMGRTWRSQSGNLHASGLVRLRAGDPDAATLALVAAISVHETLSVWLDRPELRLKWPNDVLASGKKVSGILLERVGDAVVIGVGVNLVHAPDDLDRAATSLAGLGVTPPDAHAVVETLSAVFGRWVEQWREEGLATIRTRWLDLAHPVGTALVANLADGETVAGVFGGLSDDCALRLHLADGSVRVIHAGDVFLA